MSSLEASLNGLDHPAGCPNSAGTDRPALRRVQTNWPCYEPDEIAAVVDVLASGRVNSLVHGDQTHAFETEFAAYCGSRFGIAVANGTIALELALRALDVGPGDEVIVPARSFFATAAAVVAVGASPVFADIDRVSQNIDPASAKRLINGRTRALICVHLGGWPCDMDGLGALAKAHGLSLIEDCAQAHGATYKGRRVGSFGDAAAFSFCTDKIISTGGEGGMLLLGDESLYSRAWAYKDHGKSLAKVRASVPSGAFRYVHDSFGSNFRMTEMQSAIGRLQLAKLPAWLARRRANAAALIRMLCDEPGLMLPMAPTELGHSYYKFNFLLAADRSRSPSTYSIFVRELIERGIPAGTGTCPDMSRETAFVTGGFVNPIDLPTAALVGSGNVTLPVDHTLDESNMAVMADAIRASLRKLPPTLEVVQ